MGISPVNGGFSIALFDFQRGKWWKIFLKDGKRYVKGMEPVYLFKTIILEHKYIYNILQGVFPW